MINRVLRNLQFVLILVIVSMLMFGAKPAAAGPLNFEEGFDYLYETAKKRGVIATLWDWNGNTSGAVALKYMELHNKAKTRNYAAVFIGGDLTFEKKPKFRPLASPALNLFDISKGIWDWRGIRNHLTVHSGPKGWEFWVGMHIRPPTRTWRRWTWKTHSGPFVSIGKRLGIGENRSEDQP